MNSNSPSPRKLEFQSLDEVAVEARRLLESHKATGNWNYVQICEHLAKWLRYPVEGYPKSGLFFSALLWMLKITMGGMMIRKILRERSMKAGNPTMPQSIASPDVVSNETALSNLESAIECFKGHAGEYLPSPLFGRLKRDQALDLQLIHCAHHLGFLMPIEGDPSD